MDSGRQARLDILRQSAEHKVLQLLQTHGWTATIGQETPAGEYFIITAERGNHRRMIALLYSCATDNGIYRSLAQQVEHIFYDGSPYKQDAYTKGVDKPVGPVSGFFDLLLTWNAQSADGLFAAGAEDEEDEIDVGPPSRVVLSETPIDAIWLRLRQFHSVTLAEKLIRERGRRDQVERPEQAWRTKAEGVAFALRNATDYFQSDVGRNVSQRILNLYYGSIAFAFAEMLASPRGPATLAEIEDSTKQGHGLYTLDGPTAGLQDLVVGPLTSGFFPSWLKFLEVDLRAFPSKKPKAPTDLAAQVSGHHVIMETALRPDPRGGRYFQRDFRQSCTLANTYVRWSRKHEYGFLGREAQAIQNLRHLD